MLPLGATTTSSNCRFVSRLAVKRYPTCCWLESTELTMRIRIRVPAGTVTLLVTACVCPCPATAKPNPMNRAAAQTIAYRMFFLTHSTSVSLPNNGQVRGNLKIDDCQQLIFNLEKARGLDRPH